MLIVTDAQLNAWLAAAMFPLARLLGLFAVAPVFSNRGAPARVRLAVGLAISLALLPALPPMPPIVPASGIGLAVFAQQIFIGIAIGFMLRIAFATVDMAGALIGMQMGLSFAIFFDPDQGGQTAVLSDFLSLFTTLLFLAINGHLMLIEVLVRSFEWLPVSAASVRVDGWSFIVHAGAGIFSTGLLISLPVIGVLLVANISLGVLTRAAPQLNLFAVGFPVTLSAGLFSLLLIMSNFGALLQSIFSRAIEATGLMLEALSPLPLP